MGYILLFTFWKRRNNDTIKVKAPVNQYKTLGLMAWSIGPDLSEFCWSDDPGIQEVKAGGSEVTIKFRRPTTLFFLQFLKDPGTEEKGLQDMARDVGVAHIRRATYIEHSKPFWATPQHQESDMVEMQWNMTWV